MRRLERPIPGASFETSSFCSSHAAGAVVAGPIRKEGISQSDLDVIVNVVEQVVSGSVPVVPFVSTAISKSSIEIPISTKYTAVSARILARPVPSTEVSEDIGEYQVWNSRIVGETVSLSIELEKLY